jgi:hypothetical protein
MCYYVAFSAQGYEILVGVVAVVTTKYYVMDLKVAHNAAYLTTPTIPSQDPLMKVAIVILAQFDSVLL